MTCLLSRKACAAYLGVSRQTIRYWDTGRYRVPWSVVRLLRLLRCGDLGGIDDAWEGFYLLRGVLYTPDGRGFPVDALRCWWQVVEQARFWREDYDRKAQARRQASRDRREPVGHAVPIPADGGALDPVPVADDPTRAVTGHVARDPHPTITPEAAFRPSTATAPHLTMPNGSVEPTQRGRQSDKPHRKRRRLAWLTRQ